MTPSPFARDATVAGVLVLVLLFASVVFAALVWGCFRGALPDDSMWDAGENNICHPVPGRPVGLLTPDERRVLCGPGRVETP